MYSNRLHHAGVVGVGDRTQHMHAGRERHCGAAVCGELKERRGAGARRSDIIHPGTAPAPSQGCVPAVLVSSGLELFARQLPGEEVTHGLGEAMASSSTRSPRADLPPLPVAAVSQRGGVCAADGQEHSARSAEAEAGGLNECIRSRFCGAADVCALERREELPYSGVRGELRVRNFKPPRRRCGWHPPRRGGIVRGDSSDNSFTVFAPAARPLCEEGGGWRSDPSSGSDRFAGTASSGCRGAGGMIGTAWTASTAACPAHCGEQSGHADPWVCRVRGCPAG